MIKLKTEVTIPESKKKMGYRQQAMMIGSCFTENIGDYLKELCFPVIVNPFGILYNPISIANCLRDLIDRKKYTIEDLFYHNGLYSSFLHHGRFSGPDPVTTLERINAEAAKAADVIKSSSHLFITFGTSSVFKHKVSGAVVSNCHKLPAETFDHFRMPVSQITEIWIPLIAELRRINPDLHLIFTVSPIRHLKDGAHENQLSKSTLLMASEALISFYAIDFISYFASYELVLDELRDYRFFAADMAHLSDVAIDFIREKFTEAILDEEAKIISSELAKILKALNHRPLIYNEISYLSFIRDQIAKTDRLQNKYPFVDLKNVIKKLHEKIAD